MIWRVRTTKLADMLAARRDFLVFFSIMVVLICSIHAGRLGLALAASSHVPPPCANGTTNLEDPNTAMAYSANSWVAQHTIHPGTAVTIYTGAYDQKESTGQPVVSAVMVLNSAFQNVGGRWSLSTTNTGNASPVAPDCTQKGAKSTLYEYTGSWLTPMTPGIYYLAVTFTFTDGTQVQFFTNMRVVALDQPLPQMHTLWYDTSSIAGLPPQNTDNSAYNIFAAGNVAHLSSTYYFNGNPAATASVSDPSKSTSTLVSTLRSTNLLQPAIFENMPSGNGGAPIVLPRLAPGQSSVSTSFLYYSYDSVSGAPDLQQNGTITVINKTANPVQIGSDAYTYLVTVDEPFTVRSGTKANLLVGPYIVDNGFSGPVADGQGSQGDNLGEGRFYAFYSNPTPPLPTQPDTTHLRFTWSPPDPSTWDSATTSVSYILTVLDATAVQAGALVEHTYRTGALTQDVPGSAGDPFLIVPGHEYAASVQAIFTFADGSRITSSSIDGPPITARTSGGPPPTETATVPPTDPAPPPATATDTPLPTATDTPPPTQTPTPPDTPTDTPTPRPGLAALRVDPDPGCYAWVFLKGSPGNKVSNDAPIVYTRRHERVR